MVHRSFANQLADYQFIAETVRRADTAKSRTQKRKTSRTSSKVGAAAARLLAGQGELSYFALHKLLFLAEVRHLEATDERLTEAYFVRQKDGPYCVEFHGSRISTLVPGAQTRLVRGRLIVALDRQKSLYAAPVADALLSENELRTLDHVGHKYGSLSDSDLKRVTYMAGPMREMLRREKALRVNLFNSAVLPPKS